LLADLHADVARQGPGSDEATRRALELARLAPGGRLDVADLGCGSGASTLILAGLPEARIKAVDLMPSFVARLRAEVERRGLDARVEIAEAHMADPPLAPRSVDLIWSEGAIYNIGFERGVRAWRGLLRPGGVLAVTEITWTTRRRPASIEQYWQAEYPEIDTAAGKMAVLERSGYSPLGYFTLPEACWEEHYYQPLEAAFDDFLARHDDSAAARELVAATRAEIGIYRRYLAWYGYGFYIAERRED